MFRVPSSTSPPATPEKHGFFATSNPSTTPAGPPPTAFTAASTTPAGLPPSSVFGSVQYNQAIPFNSSVAPYRNAHRTSPSRLRQTTVRDEVDDDDDDAMDEDQDIESSALLNESIITSVEGFNVPAIAKSLGIKPTSLHETDSMILETELIVADIFAFSKTVAQSNTSMETALSAAVENLLAVWRRSQDNRRQQLGIGPGEKASPVTKALFLASLPLMFHHASPRKIQGSGVQRSAHDADQAKSIPEILLEWLRDYHNQYPGDFPETIRAEPNPCAHERFWDVIFSLTLRGEISNVIQLLKVSDYRFASSALEDGAEEPGYHGKQLRNVERVMNRALILMETCPAVTSHDWNVKSAEWSIFRQRVGLALSDLETFAEGSSADWQTGEKDAFEAENFGLASVRSDDFSISTMSRRAESRVPWTIYQNLNSLYGQLLGTHREVVAAGADWVEATIGLTVWWDGEDDAGSRSKITKGRASFARSQSVRNIDVLPRTAYQQKLALSLQQIVAENEDAELQPNTTNPIHVGLACIFDNDLQGLISILEGLSWPIATALVEIAHLGSWLNTAPSPSRSIMNGFDKSDLMVLSFAPQSGTGVQRDQVLVSYAERLYARPRLQQGRSSEFKDGWELAIEVLGRTDNASLAENHITKLLDRLDLTVPDRIEKVMAHCFQVKLPSVARSMAERYADDLATNTHNYGGALYYYARAHKASRVKDVVNVLNSCCLVQSLAYPPHSIVDAKLASMINSPKPTLARLALLDRDAAELLATQMSGYAMLRRFYELRDQGYVTTGTVQPSISGFAARKKEAALTLVALIQSAADSIHGGLYDSSIESVVQVDGLLVLLGECLVFLNQQKRVLGNSEVFTLMQAAEDISTVSSSVYEQCEEVFKSALAHAHDHESPPSPRALLAKSIASLSASRASMTGSGSEFSLIGSKDASLGSRSRVFQEGRGWDWRVGMKRDAVGEDMLEILRLGLAREVSRIWADGEV